MLLGAVERGGEIGDEIGGIFNANRVADQIIFDTDHDTFFGAQLIETHQRGLFDQAFNATKGWSDLRNPAGVDYPRSCLEVAGYFKRNHTAKAVHLAPRDIVVGM